MESEIKELCDKFGGLWQFVKSPQYAFCEGKINVLEKIIFAVGEYRNTKRELKLNYLGTEDLIPRYSLRFVIQLLTENSIQFSGNDSEEILRQLAYRHCKNKIKEYTEMSLRLCRIY